MHDVQFTTRAGPARNTNGKTDRSKRRHADSRTTNEELTMNTRRIGRSLPRVLAGTVLIGSLAFAAQVESQQQSGTQGRKPERGAGQRGPGGEGRRGGPGSDSLRVERRLGMLT